MTAPRATRDNLRLAWPVLVGLAACPAWLVAAVLGAPRLVTFPLAVVMIAAPSLGAYVWLRTQDGMGRRPALVSVVSGLAGAVARGAFLLGVALSVTFTVLFVVGGFYDGVFHDEDVVLLTVCWGVLALLWLAGRYIPALMRRRVEDA
jgi:hypothetical protein